MTVGSREDLFANAQPIDETERLIDRVLAGKCLIRWCTCARFFSLVGGCTGDLLYVLLLEASILSSETLDSS